MTRGRVVVLVVVMLLLSACVPASPDSETFDDQATNTAGTAVSETRTVQRLVGLSGEEQILRATAVAQLRYSHDGLAAAAKAFSDLSPPRARERLANQLAALLVEAEALVVEARVAIERKAVEDYEGVARRLEAVAKDLEAVEASVA